MPGLPPAVDETIRPVVQDLRFTGGIPGAVNTPRWLARPNLSAMGVERFKNTFSSREDIGVGSRQFENYAVALFGLGVASVKYAEMGKDIAYAPPADRERLE